MSDEHRPTRGEAGGPSRHASVQLRTQDDSAGGDVLLDQANRSALDALHIAYTIMSWIMLGLVGLFVLSGFQSVNEGERAVRLRFGRIVDANLGAGFQFAYPPPIGELIKIPIGQQAMRIDTAFYPELTERQRRQTPEELGKGGGFRSYDPTKDGSLITADQNLAHAKVQILYERSRPTDWLTNIDPQSEQEIIRVAVERAVVRAMAEITIDDLVKQTSGSEGSVARRAEQFAQESLDRLDSGIQIVRLDMIDPGPPIGLYNDFAAVNSAQSNANAERDRAEQDARTKLNKVAGAGARPLIELIDRYERATDLGEKEEQQRVMAVIGKVLLGESATLEAMTEGESALTFSEGLVSGEVTQLISDAETYRRQVPDEAFADRTRFLAKLDQYNSNRRVLIVNEWSDAMREFLKKDSVQAMFIPAGTDVLELLLNRDPQIMRDQEKARNRRQIEEADEARTEILRQQSTQLRNVDQGDSR
ncbi:MAG TPA: hypothetical protein ENJ00_03805 [Phycisphaerales bacterium]|nr:hypothetical protein [Phycisphaerales bacterium]